jgi:hypothetical protein
MEQLQYFYELSYWLMTISKVRTRDSMDEIAPIGPVLDFSAIGDPNEIAK